MSMMDMEGVELDLDSLANPQLLYKGLRDTAPVVPVDTMGGMVVVGACDDVREVLAQPEIFSSGVDAVNIGQIRPLIPLQIDPPEHKAYRKLLDPIFAPKKVAPSTVFLQLLGLPVSRAKEFIALKDGIVRPPARTPEQRIEMVAETGRQIYAVLEEVVDERTAERRDDFISMFIDAEVDGHSLSREDVIDICYLFFLAGLDTVTASLDCFLAYLAQHPEHRRQLVDDPSLIPHAIEEMLRWESPVAGIIRIATEDTEIKGCPISKGTTVSVMLGSANTDESFWDHADVIDFNRSNNKHIAFGGGVHRCLGSHLARMELRVAMEEWHRSVPEYSLKPGIQLRYSQGLRSVDNLELVW
jgi:cytochrome P450